MEKNNQKFSGIQADIFQQLEKPSEAAEYSDDFDLDIQAELRGSLATACKIAKRSGLTRERIVDEMNRLMPDLDKKITKRKLDAWLATSKEDHEFPARFIPAFCAATRCHLPLQTLANTINLELADQRELLAQQYGELEIQRAKLARQSLKLKQQIGKN